MYRRIILAYDGSSSGQKALLGMKDLGQWQQAKITLVAVMPVAEMEVGAVEMGYLGHVSTPALENELRAILKEGVQTLTTLGFVADGALLKDETIGAITSYAREQQADLIVVGHKHEKSLLRRWWSGSTAKSLVEESPCNVLVRVSSD